MEHLSTGVLNVIMNGGEVVDDPICLQYLGSKLITNDRHRLWLSDGETITSLSFIENENVHLIRDGILTVFAVCKINFRLAKSKIATKPIMMITTIEVVISGDEIGETLGNPVSYEKKLIEAQQEAPAVQEPTVQSQVVQASQNSVITVPIMSISPYYGRWTIRARVSDKTEIKYWNNPRSQGKLFSMDLIDESGEIRCTGFNDQVDAFFPVLEKGNIYYITRCQVKPANKKYSTIKHEFELVLNAETAILKYDGESANIPMIMFDFSPINEIEWREVDSVLDILAVVKNIGDVLKLKSKKTGADLIKRDILLVDDSNAMISLTLWGNQGEQFNKTEHLNTVLAIKAVKISEFNGAKSLSTVSSTIIQFNPAIPETENLLSWFNETDQAKDAKFLSSPSTLSSINCPWLNFQEARELNVGVAENINTFLTRASIGTVKSRNAIYKACPTEGCRKKLTDIENGMYHCVKCNLDFPNFTYRFLMQATLLDHTDELSVTIFETEAEKILQKNAKQVGEIYDNLPTECYENIYNNCKLKSFIFKIRMKQEFFNDTSRIKAVVLNVAPVDEIDYCSHLLKEMKTFLAKKPVEN